MAYFGLKGLMIVALPTVGIHMSRTLMSFVDYGFAGRLGTTAVAAVGPANLTAWILTGFACGSVAIVSSFSSQSLGQGDEPQAGAYAVQGLYAGILVSLLVVPGWLFADELMGLYGHSPEVFTLELAFFEVLAFAHLPSVAAFAMQSFFIGIHRPWVAVGAAIGANVVNVIINYILVFGVFGIEPMGIVGAAWGTVVATSVQALLSFLLFFLPSLSSFRMPQMWKPQRAHLFGILRFGLPGGFSWVQDVAAWGIFINVYCGSLGTLALAASNSALQFMRMSFIPCHGLGSALSVMVGEALGRGQPMEARQRVWEGFGLGALWLVMCGVGFFFYGEVLMGLFVSDPALITLGGKVLQVAAVFQFVDSISILLMHVLRGGGDTLATALILTTSIWGVMVFGGGLYLSLSKAPDLIQVWWIGTLALIVGGAATYIRFHLGHWQRIDIFGKKSVR